MSNKQFFETTGRYVTLPESCEGCGECCKNFAALVDSSGAKFFESTSTETAHVLVTPVEVRSKLSKNEQNARVARALATNLGLSQRTTAINRIAKGDGLVAINGRCGNLDEDNRCAKYEDRPEKPCREVVMGSYGCLFALDLAQNPHFISQQPLDQRS